MKQRHLFGFLVCLAVATIACADNTPRITFDKTTYDFGATALVQSVTGTFTFQNTGTALLELGKPVPGCGCTIANLSTNKLEPGQKGEMVFSVNVGTTPHKMNKQITMVSNDPTTPAAILGIVIEIKKVFELQPLALMVGDMRFGAKTNAEVLVKRIDGKDLEITKVESTDSSIYASTEAVPGDPTSARMKISVKAAAPARQLVHQIQFTTSDSKGPAGSIIITGQIVDDVKVEPSVLNWPVSPVKGQVPEQSRSRLITIQATQTEHPLRPTNVVCTIPELKVELQPGIPGRQFNLKVRLPENLDHALNGFISFETGVESIPKIQVPVNVLYQKM